MAGRGRTRGRTTPGSKSGMCMSMLALHVEELLASCTHHANVASVCMKQVMTQAQTRPTYREQANSNAPLSTVRPRPMVPVPVEAWRVAGDTSGARPTVDRDVYDVQREVDAVINAVDERTQDHEAALVEAKNAVEAVRLHSILLLDSCHKRQLA